MTPTWNTKQDGGWGTYFNSPGMQRGNGLSFGGGAYGWAPPEHKAGDVVRTADEIAQPFDNIQSERLDAKSDALDAANASLRGFLGNYVDRQGITNPEARQAAINGLAAGPGQTGGTSLNGIFETLGAGAGGGELYQRYYDEIANSPGDPDAVAASRGIRDWFGENATRQQQAYGQMQGGNYFGGMMDGRYSQAFGGQMQQGGNGDPTSASAFAVPGASSFSDTFNAKKKPPANQFKVGGWGSYNGWG